MPKFKTVITTVGAAKIAAVLAGTGSIVLDSNARMAVGDGNGTLPTPDPSQTALVKEVYRAALNTASIDASNPKNIIAELIIPPDKGGFWMREMALYDAAGTLLAVGNMAETYKPSLSEGAGRKQVIRMVIAVSDVTAVTITMDSSTVMATQDYVDSKLSDHEKSRKHPDATLTDKGFTQLSSETDSVSEAKAATPKAVKTVMDAVTTKAPTASPALTGTPTAPTAPADTNSTQLATTAFVVAALARLVNSSPAVLDTLGELAAALGNDPNFATTMTTALANKQPLDATLTSLAGLVNGANKLPYFTGTDQMATADLSAFIRIMLGKGDAAAVLQYLGFTDIGIGTNIPGADKPLLANAKSSGFYIYGGGSDADFGPDFGVVITILYDAVSDIRVQMYIPLTNHSGTSPIIRGIHSGATTWKYKLYSENNKPSLSELGLSAGSPPIGIPFFWPSSAMPNTVMPEWSEMVFLKMNDATFSANTYPLLAKVWPSLKLTDCRGEFIRIADDGRGVDAGRTVLSAQGDTLQNITGEIGIVQYVGPTHEEGALYAGGSQWKTVTTDGGETVAQSIFFDASKSARTSSETRSRNIAFNFLVRAK